MKRWVQEKAKATINKGLYPKLGKFRVQQSKIQSFTWKQIWKTLLKKISEDDSRTRSAWSSSV